MLRCVIVKINTQVLPEYSYNDNKSFLVYDFKGHVTLKADVGSPFIVGLIGRLATTSKTIIICYC